MFGFEHKQLKLSRQSKSDPQTDLAQQYHRIQHHNLQLYHQSSIQKPLQTQPSDPNNQSGRAYLQKLYSFLFAIHLKQTTTPTTIQIHNRKMKGSTYQQTFQDPSYHSVQSIQPEEFERESQCEDYADYLPGGYHPVRIGEKFNNNVYTVVQKLGWGYFSTVWLVRKQETNEYFALKIQRSKKSHTQSANDQIRILKQLKKHQTDVEWLQFLQTHQAQHPKKLNLKLCRPLILFDNFPHHGIHGKHICSVFQLMGPNLLDLIQHYEFSQKKMPLWLVKKVTREVLVGLVYLHERCNLIHTDLKPENIMIKLESHEERKFVQQLLDYRVKPMSMKYLKTLQAHKNGRNMKNAKEEQLEEGQVEQKQEEQVQSVQLNKSAQLSQNQSILSRSDIRTVSSSSNLANNQNPMANCKVHYQNEANEDEDVFQSVVNEEQNAIINPPNQPKTLNQIQAQQQADKQNVQKVVDINVLIWKDVQININSNLFFKIGDLGNSCYANRHFSESIQTRQYRSPEVILGHSYSHSADIFSLACVVFQLITNTFLFKPNYTAGVDKDEEHLYQMMEILGPMDKEYSLTGKYSAEYFNKRGKLKNGNPTKKLSISHLLYKNYHYPPQIAAVVEEFLLPMLAYEPKCRISARECLKSRWLWL